MREAGRVVGEHAAVGSRLPSKPGISLAELEAIGAACIKNTAPTPSFLDYRPHSAPTPYPAMLCLSVNDVIVHGIPDAIGPPGRRHPLDRLRRGGRRVPRRRRRDGAGRPGRRRRGTPDETTREALTAAIKTAVPGGRLGDMSHAVETAARPYGLLEGYGGHGVGTAMHEDPHVANTGRPGRGMRIRRGWSSPSSRCSSRVAATPGAPLPDGWSIATADGSRAAHVEHTVAVTAGGPMSSPRRKKTARARRGARARQAGSVSRMRPGALELGAAAPRHLAAEARVTAALISPAARRTAILSCRSVGAPPGSR